MALFTIQGADAMRFELIVDYCMFEHVPKDQSRTYRNLFITLGEKVANQYTYERGANYDPPIGISGMDLGAPGRDYDKRHTLAHTP